VADPDALIPGLNHGSAAAINDHRIMSSIYELTAPTSQNKKNLNSMKITIQFLIVRDGLVAQDVGRSAGYTAGPASSPSTTWCHGKL
jgi:hypothetical protein